MDDNPMLSLSEDEASELYQYTRYAYISIQQYPALCRLIARLPEPVNEEETA
jgi:hypothetical protein